MRTGYTISGIVHGLMLAWGLLALPAQPFEMPPPDSITADVISEREFSQLTAGSRTAPKAAKPLPVVDQVGEPKPNVTEPLPRVVNKPEIRTASAEPTLPKPPEVKPPDPKPPEPKPPQPKPPELKPPEAAPPEPKPSAAKPDPPKPEPDLVAEALKKEEAKRKEERKKADEAKKVEEARKREEAKREEAKRREEAKKQEERKFDLDRIQTALIDKRTPQRQSVTGAFVNNNPSLGSPNANAPELSQNELDALRSQLMGCWNPPVGVAEAKDLVVIVHFTLNRDGTVSGEPSVINRGSGGLFQVAAESATRAVRRCAPFRLPAAKYEAWRDVEVKFDPNDMFRG
jgi:outer membrane biosynthesis protein TonB